ncbi:MAG: hypothetical protein ABWW69_07170 [Pyrodictiaceae archaeon]
MAVAGVEALISLSTILGWIVLALVVGVLTGLKRRFSLEGYLVSGRTLSAILPYMLLVAEIHGVYAFLGVAEPRHAHNVCFRLWLASL